MQFIVMILFFMLPETFAEVENERLVMSCEVIGSGDDPGPESFAINLYQLGPSQFALKEISTEHGITKIKTLSNEIRKCRHLKEYPTVFNCTGPMTSKVSMISAELNTNLVASRHADGPRPLERKLINIYIYPGDIRPDFVFSPKNCRAYW